EGRRKVPKTSTAVPSFGHAGRQASAPLARVHVSHAAGSNASVNRHRRTSHKRSICRAEEQTDPSDLFRVSNAPERIMLGDTLNLRRIIDINDPAKHRRQHPSGADTVNPNVLLAMIEGQRFGEVDHTSFSSTIGKVLRHTYQSSNRGNIHDATTTAAAHGWNRRLTAEKDTFEVRVQNPVPVLLGCVFNPFKQSCASIVDENV